MPLQPLKDISDYKRVKERLRNRFDAERTGDQSLFTEQAKLLQPLINTQEKTVKAIQGNKDLGLSVLTKELQRRNDQFDLLSEQPFYQYEIDQSLPAIKAAEHIDINLDSNLSETDKTNLRNMHLKLPSEVFKDKKIEQVLDKIKTENRRVGQHLSKKSTVTEKERELYASQRKTLKIYEQKIHGLEGAKQFIGKGLNKKNLPDVILYQNTDELISKLEQLYAAKKARNTGLDNQLISILDELLRVKTITKDEYNQLYKNIMYIK